MSDGTFEEHVQVLPAKGDEEYVSKRGRRILTAVLILLIIILLVTTFLLTQLLRPPGIPNVDDLAGITWVRSIYGFGPDATQMNEPASVSVLPNGEGFWVTDQVRFRVIKYDPSGNLIEVFSGDTLNDDVLKFPAEITAAPDGWFYIAEPTHDQVRAYNAEGRLQFILNVPSPLALAANDDRLLIGTTYGVTVYTREGEHVGMVGTRGRGEDQFDGVNGVALDEDNNAYIVDSFNNRISKFDATGRRVWMVNVGPPGNEVGANQMDAEQLTEIAERYPARMQVPMGATIDGAGRLIVIDLLDFSIAAFDTEDGSFIAKWGQHGSEDGKFMYPADIEYDPAHDWFIVADSGNQRAQVIRLPDSGGTAMTALRPMLAGPLMACSLPFAVLLILLAVWALRARARRKAQDVVAEPMPRPTVGAP